MEEEPQGFLCGSAGKTSACSAGDLRSISGSSPGEGKGYPFQYSGPENSMDCIVHGVAKSQTRLSDFTWRRTWKPTPVFLPQESHGQRCPGGLQSMGSHRVRHDLASKQQQLHRYRKQTSGYQRRDRGWWDKLGIWD